MTAHRTSTVSAISLAVVITLLLAMAGALQRVREGAFSVDPIAEQPLYVTSGPLLRGLTVGYDALAADVYWIRAVQYYGAERLRLAGPSSNPARTHQVAGFGLLDPLLDATTTLDPLFNVAYRFGAIFLAEPFPGGAGRPDLAIALLEKGLRERPEKWEYMLDIGYVHYWWRRDYRSAGQWFERASTVAGAPWWTGSLAAVTLAEGGDRQSARLMWEAILETAEIQYLREHAERSLAQLRALDDIDELQDAVDRTAARAGVPPADWAALVSARVVPGVPVDPSGTPYLIDSAGRVRLSTSSRLHPLPNEPRRRVAPIP